MTHIGHEDQTLPVEIEKFWQVSKNKVAFQQLFVKWLLKKDLKEVTIYFGGSALKSENACLVNSCAKEEPLLKCCYEEADDRMMFHLSHGVKVDEFESVVMCSTDADVYVSAAYHYSSLSSFGLNDFWLVSGNKSTRKCIPLHMITQVLNSRTIKNLPAA